MFYDVIDFKNTVIKIFYKNKTIKNVNKNLNNEKHEKNDINRVFIFEKL